MVGYLIKQEIITVGYFINLILVLKNAYLFQIM